MEHGLIRNEEKAKVLELAIKALDGDILLEECKELEGYISSSKTLAAYYSTCIKTHLSMLEFESSYDLLKQKNDSTLDREFWQMLAIYEQISPEVEIPTVSQEPEAGEKMVEIKKVHPKVSKFSIFSLLLSSAALIFLIVYALFVPANRGIEVATLSDSLNAKWADSDRMMRDGMRLVTKSDSLWLQEGIAKLVFDNGSVVVLEGPSNFEILTEDQIQLDYGRLYASVPKKAMGFTVSTANAKIIDLGTEFGIKADPDGMEVHMLRGKTLLISGSVKDTKNQYELCQGQAKAVLKTGSVQDISLKKESFIRRIDSKTGFIWKGRNTIDLADIIGGGNGFGTGQVDMATDPISGKLTRDMPGRRESANDYHPVPSSPYIDGVFVPNGRTKQIISSQGHLFQECPVTSGLCCYNISYELRSPDLQTTLNSTASVSPAGHTLLIHANMGITFDLQAIRGLLPGVNIVRFQSKFGIRKWNPRPSISNADFWILIDGKLRYKKEQVRTDELHSVDIELSENDRFLTFIETDGGDPENRTLDGLDLPAIDSDWGIFADPVLVLE